MGWIHYRKFKWRLSRANAPTHAWRPKNGLPTIFSFGAEAISMQVPNKGITWPQLFHNNTSGTYRSKNLIQCRNPWASWDKFTIVSSWDEFTIVSSNSNCNIPVHPRSVKIHCSLLVRSSHDVVRDGETMSLDWLVHNQEPEVLKIVKPPQYHSTPP